jgi:predicted phosphodiesterase
MAAMTRRELRWWSWRGTRLCVLVVWEDLTVRVAALYDIHGNLPALRAVLADIAPEGVEVVVIGGDVAAGPLPRETIEQVIALGPRARCVRGNADREVVDAYDRGRRTAEEESGPAERTAAFAAAQISLAQRDFLADFPTTVVLDINGLGPTVFCHGSPRSDTEIITTATSDERLSEILFGVSEAVVVGGHTHRQFDRRVGDRRFINAGSVGSPYEGRAGAYWALLGPDVSFRRTVYDVTDAAEQLRATGFPDLDEMLRESLTDPVDPDEVAAFFENLASAS